jgi:Putative beta-barrel porin-2, OmpL-like. bbp2
MKYNKWTVALAALGVVSLASAAKAEEKASPVMTALSSTTISGYVDTSAEWNWGTGNGNLPPYKFNSENKADGFNLDVIQLRIDKPLDEADWAAGYRVDLWFGPDANALNTTSTGFANANSDFAIRQGYVALRAPIGTGLDFKMGVFDSIIGYESVESGNNPNFTRSYGHSIEPQTMTGLLASYRFCDVFSISGGVADTWNQTINDRAFAPVNAGAAGVAPYSAPTQSESYKAYMGSFALTAPDSMGFLSGSTLYGGIVNGFSDLGAVNALATRPITLTSYYLGATIATPVTGLRAGAAFDYLDIHNLNNDDFSVAGYLSYQATDKLSFHGRVEYFKDKLDDAVINADRGLLYGPAGRLGPGQDKAEVLALTGTVQYDLWKNVISRLEIRWDHSLTGGDLYGGTIPGNPNSAANRFEGQMNAVMVAANLIYKF